MRRFIVLAGLVSLGAISQASDHNNLSKDRPLRFEDAYSGAFRSWEFQAGLRFDFFDRNRPVYNFRSELQYGFGKNKDISIGFEPLYSTDSGRILGNVTELSYFEGVQREIGSSPAIGYRLEAGFPVSGGRGVELKARGILTKTARHYDKLHLNLDVSHHTESNFGERQTRLGLILGYSSPIGYPKRFDDTFLAEIGFEQSRQVGGGIDGWIGVGLRKQVSPTAVFDFGIQSDFLRGSGASRLTLGYSMAF